MLRRPEPEDIGLLAQLHVQTWAETYVGLLPEAEIARHNLAFRKAQWARVLAADLNRICYAPGYGFAVMGPQRNVARAGEWPDELYSLYLIQVAQGRGLGRALLDAVRSGRPFTADVVVGNVRAERFYAAAGGVELSRRAERVGSMEITEVSLGFAR
jgi:GNAT superfamily N-acetyltransferase